MTESTDVERALRNSEHFNRILFEQSTSGLALCRMDGAFIEVNSTLAAIIGRTVEELASLKFRDILPEKHAADGDWLETLRATVRQGPRDVEYVHKNGHLVSVRLQASVVQRQDEEFILLRVEDRATNQATGDRTGVHVDRLHKLVGLSMSLTGNPVDVFRNLTRIIGELLDVPVVCLSEIRRDQLHFVSVYANGEAMVDAGRCSLDITPCATVEDSKDIRVYDKVAERFPKAHFLKTHNAHAYCGFPALDSNGKVVAVTCLLDDKPRQFSEDELEFLRIFGQRIGMEIERQHTEETVRIIAAGVSAQTGEAFFQSLVTHLAKIFDVGCQFIGLLDENKPNTIETIALCIDGNIVDNRSYELANTPCEHVLGRAGDAVGAYPKDVQRLFPDDAILKELDVQSYIGVPLVDSDGTAIGLIGIMGYKPLENIERVETVLQIFATRAAGEIVRLKAEQALRVSEASLADAQHRARIGSWELDLVSNSLNWSDEIFRIFEIDSRRFKASYEAFLDTVHPDDRHKVNAAYTESIKNKTPYSIEHRLRMPDGRIKYVSEHCETFYNEAGEPMRSKGTVQDITDRVNMEQTIRRSQKMEAIGQLSGGIAHDFNNQLGVIIGYLDFLAHAFEKGEKQRQWVDAATGAALRCTDLTRQLLTFSRRQVKTKEVLNPNDTLQNLESMIQRSVTPEVEVQYYLSDNLWLTETDPGEFEDAIVNLVMNARDAMPRGGRLMIETTNKQLDRDYVKLNPGVQAGDYVQLMLSDTGTGMNNEILEHIFEPFFTTKPEGKGTGLGMAMVYGFVKRYGGHIKIYSEPDVGTTLRLYLPRSAASKSTVSIENHNRIALPTGKESILIVDDEVDLLKLADLYLSDLGYRTRTAENAAQAINILVNDENIDLLFSDVVMPGGVNGYELAQQAVELRPRLKILLTSGFTSKTIAHNGLARFATNLLSKPYRKIELAQHVRRVLDTAKELESLEA